MTSKTVYFARAEGTNLIKIGASDQPAPRIHEMNRISPVEITLLATTNAISERDAHERFAHLVARGEWFFAARELVDFITQVTGVSLEIPTRRKALNGATPLRALGGRSKGAHELAAYVERLGVTQTAVAELIGVKQSAVGRWICGERLPDISSAARVEAVTGILARSWGEPADVISTDSAAE